MSKHERGKQQRRQQILKSARSMITRASDLGFSMRTLSAESELSAATLYNLFGSKDGIVLELLNDSLRDFEARVLAVTPSDGLDRLFATLTVARDLYASDESFFRPFFGVLLANADPDLRRAYFRPRLLFYRRLVHQAMQEKWLRNDLDDEDVARAVVQLMATAIFDWGQNHVQLDELHRQLVVGVSLILKGAATSEGSLAIEDRGYLRASAGPARSAFRRIRTANTSKKDKKAKT
jgi:AcrR family transcriptional regulator